MVAFRAHNPKVVGSIPTIATDLMVGRVYTNRWGDFLPFFPPPHFFKGIMKKRLDKNILDLHGVRHHEVQIMVENFVILNKPPLTIITGNSHKMEDIVLTTLSELRISWERFTWGEIKILQN
jgi:hypothetical protein